MGDPERESTKRDVEVLLRGAAKLDLLNVVARPVVASQQSRIQRIAIDSDRLAADPVTVLSCTFGTGICVPDPTGEPVAHTSIPP